jgi:hypothetical protein
MLEDYSSRPLRLLEAILLDYKVVRGLSYGPPWAHCLGGYQDQLLGGPLGLLGLCHTAPDDVRRKDYGGEVLGPLSWIYASSCSLIQSIQSYTAYMT